MPAPPAELSPPARGQVWKWWVCGLLLLATMINYMDRLTLNQTAKRIKDELVLNNEQYGWVEFAFGIAFAVGALVVGWVVDRWNVRWVFPAALLAWSAAGFATGFAGGLSTLLLCRFLLGLFEAGNWPCALRTTQRILRPDQRTMGNSILQSGAAIGAIITPLVVQAFLDGRALQWLADTWPALRPVLHEALEDGTGRWRYPFFVVGAAGSVWVLLWLLSVRRDDLALPRPGAAPAPAAADKHEGSVTGVFRDWRFYVLVVIVISINLTWHFFRVWLPLFLRESRGYSEAEVNYFTSGYYAAADAGSLAAGFATLVLARWGVAVHRSRVAVFLACALLVALSVRVAYLDAGPLLLGLLLVIAFGALGVFPVYYSLSQELTVRHQGKVTGMLGCSTWVATAVMHPLVGRWIDQTKDYSSVLVLAGLFPLLAFAVLAVMWRAPAGTRAGPVPPPPPATSGPGG
jgi:MFS transporter, ACS family, hexuronate transporter